MRTSGAFLAFDALCASAGLLPFEGSQAIAAPYALESIAIFEIGADHGVSTTLQKAMSTLDTLHTLPTCKRMATGALLASCATLEAPTSETERMPGTDAMLDDERRLYAARISVCDLQGAHVHIPHSCEVFLPTTHNAKKRVVKGWFGSDGPSEPVETFPDYEAITAANLYDCISALHDDGNSQGWTTFEHNFHDSAANCYALRGDIDKDAQINLFSTLVKTAADVESVLASSRDSWSESMQQWREVQVLSRQVFTDLNRDAAGYRDVVFRFDAQLAAALQALNDVAASVRRIQIESDLTVDIVKGGHREMQDSLSRAQGELVQLTVAQKQQWHAALTQGTVTIDNLLAYVHEHFVQSAEQATGKAVQHMQHTFATAVDEMRVNFRNQTADFHQELDEARDKARFLNGDWSSLFGWLKTAISFFGYLCVYTLFNYAFWQRLTSLSISGNICVSLAFGIVLANSSIAFGDPMDLVAYVASQGKTLPIVIYICIGGALAIIGLLMWLAGRALHFPALGRDSAEERRLLRPTDADESANFRLLVNNPRYMVERQASFKKWQR